VLRAFKFRRYQILNTAKFAALKRKNLGISGLLRYGAQMTSEQKLKKAVGGVIGAEIRSITPVSGGCISQAGILTLSNGDKLFLKWNASAPEGFFKAEADGLNEMRKCPAVRVPQVNSVSESTADVPAFIVLEALSPGESANSQEALGYQLAELHKVQSDKFGFHSRNFIGITVQHNDYHNSWGDFFFKERLVRQAEAGRRAGWFDDQLNSLLFSNEEKVLNLLSETFEKPALLHGDLWSGNVMWCVDGPALIDPAVYYGNREADIAMTECFGGFSKQFYAAYNEHYPLEEGYEHRKDILNLYHLMNHANIFGGHYVSSVKTSLKNFSET